MGNQQGRRLAVDDTKLPAKIFQMNYIDCGRPELIPDQMARKILSATSSEDLPSVEPIMQSGIVPKCVTLLQNSIPEIQTKAAWILINIASGSAGHVNYLVQEGAMDALIQLLQSEDLELVQLAASALGNIASEREDLVVNAGALPRLIELAMSTKSPHKLRSIALSNLCAAGPVLTIETVRQLLPALTHLINTVNTEMDCGNSACLAIANLAAERILVDTRIIDEIMNTGVTCWLIQLLGSTDLKVVARSQLVIRNIVQRGTAPQIDRVLGAGPVLQTLGRLMESKEPNIEKEAVYIIASMTAHNNAVHAIISGGLVPILINVLLQKPDGGEEIKKEAARAIRNIMDPRNQDRMTYLIQIGLIPAVCSMLQWKDSDDEVLLAVKMLDTILKSSGVDDARTQAYSKAIEECGGLAMLDQIFEEHEDYECVGDGSEIYTLISKMYDTYFEDGKSGESEGSDGASPAKGQKLDI